VLLVISCPCALVISIPLGYFVGVGAASRRGILVKGANYLDALSRIKIVVFDKTGTVTKGVFRVTKVVPAPGFSAEDLIRTAAEAESQSNHPIAHSIREAYGRETGAGFAADVREAAGMGIKAKVGDHMIIAGNDRLLHEERVAHDVCVVEGTVIHVAIDNSYAGYIVISDELKEDAHAISASLRAQGVRSILMLTGDEHSVAERISTALRFDGYHADLLPEQKVEAIERIMADARAGEGVSFVGDGINDAPVIARADVGVAMGGLGSDAAIDSADVVIMTGRPSKLAEAIAIGKKTRSVIWQNIILALLIKGVFIATGIMGVADMWEAVFADVGVAVLAVFNATRVLHLGR
jgi:Cd2+/Zn2+-exporting ATPase